MPITSLEGLFEEIRRAGEVWVSEDDGATFVHLGDVKSLKVTAEPIEDEADTRGTTNQLGLTWTIEGVFKSTGPTALGQISSLTKPLTLYLSTDMGEDPQTGQGFTFRKSKLKLGPQIDLGGGESMMPFKTGGVTSNVEADNLGLTRELTWGK